MAEAGSSGLVGWFKSHLPTRESIAANRWTRPFAKHLLKPDLWRFTRRSVPRAVALGLFIAPVVPVAHTFVAALLAVPTRANIVIAAGITWLINPFTMPPFYISAYFIGKHLLRIDDVAPTNVAHGASKWASFIYDKSGPLALGTLVMATVIAAVGYLVASFGWRWKLSREWRKRRERTGG
jgi:uncharacterized protein